MKTKRIELKESGVLFNEEEHSYLLDGKELSGITGMLQRQLFPDEFDGIPVRRIMVQVYIFPVRTLTRTGSMTGHRR